VAMRRLAGKSEKLAEGYIIPTFTFDMIYEECRSGFAASTKVADAAMIGQKFSRPVLLEAFDLLIDRCILAFAKGRDTISFGRTSLMVRCTIPLGELASLFERKDSQCPQPLRKLVSEVF